MQQEGILMPNPRSSEQPRLNSAFTDKVPEVEVKKPADVRIGPDRTVVAFIKPENFRVVQTENNERMTALELIERTGAYYAANASYFDTRGQPSGTAVATGLVVSEGRVKAPSVSDLAHGRDPKRRDAFFVNKARQELNYYAVLFVTEDGQLHMTDSRLFRHYFSADKRGAFVRSDFELANQPYLGDWPKKGEKWKRKTHAPKAEPPAEADAGRPLRVTEALECGKAIVYHQKALERSYRGGEAKAARRAGIGIAIDKEGNRQVVSIVTERPMTLSQFAKYAQKIVSANGRVLADFMTLDSGWSAQAAVIDNPEAGTKSSDKVPTFIAAAPPSPRGVEIGAVSFGDIMGTKPSKVYPKIKGM